MFMKKLFSKPMSKLKTHHSSFANDNLVEKNAISKTQKYAMIIYRYPIVLALEVIE